MKTFDTMQTSGAADRKGGILYPMLLIAAIAVIIFSVLGIAAMTGYLPSALSRNGPDAGHEIEKNVNKSVSYQVRVRMNDGTHRTFYERAQPALAVGHGRHDHFNLLVTDILGFTKVFPFTRSIK